MVPAILMALGQLAPAIMPLLTKNKTAAAAAEVVSAAAQGITGTRDDQAALELIKADPAKLVEYQKAVTELSIGLYQAETQRLESVNETMRVEAVSGNWWTSGWRPYWGFISGTAFGVQMFSASYIILTKIEQASEVLSALAQLTAMWGIALTVLGVSVWQRSKDKAIISGAAAAGPSIIGALANRITGK